MIGHLTRGIIVLFVALLGVAPSLATPASAAEGDSPSTPYEIPEIWDFGGAGALDPGQEMWFRISYPGGGMGITMHFRPEDRDVKDGVKAYVNIRIGPGTQGEPNIDARGLTRIGQLTETENTGEDRLFWFNDSGEPKDIYLLVRNNTGRRVPFGLNLDWRSEPRGGMVPPRQTGSSTMFLRLGGGDVVPYFWVSTSLINQSGEQTGWANVEQLGSGELRVELGVANLPDGSYAIRLYDQAVCATPDLTPAGALIDLSADLPTLELNGELESPYQGASTPIEGGPLPTPALGGDGSAIVLHALDGGELGEPVACGLLQRTANGDATEEAAE